MMEDKAYNVSLAKNPIIKIKVIPGHFTTSTRHVNHYLDVSELKTNVLIARDVAQQLLQPGTAVMNSGGEIHIGMDCIE